MAKRIQSVDVFRLVAIVAVIVIHTTPFYMDLSADDEPYGMTFVIMDQLARFAVPFFFVVSGYFWGIKVREKGDSFALSLATKTSKRIGVVFLGWSFIYLLPYNISSIADYGILGPIKVVYWNFWGLVGHPIRTLMQGSKEHLWFLVSLIFAVYITAFFVTKNHTKLLVFLASGLYVIGVFGKAYVDTPLGIEVGFNTRNGPFTSLLLFVSGYFLSGRSNTSRWAGVGFLLFFLGTTIQFLELYLLASYFNTTMIQDYVFGTYLMGVGVAMVALSDKKIFRVGILGKIGTMTLGIYAGHLVFVDLLKPIDTRTDNFIWEIAYIFLVLGFSILGTYFLSKFKLTKRIVV